MSLFRSSTRIALLAGLACAAPASAQVSFDLLTRFAFGWGDEAVPITEPIQITQPGTYNFELQEGVFNAVGFANWGVGNWIGFIESSEPGLTRPTSPRPAPFNQLGFDGDINTAGTRIGNTRQTYIDSAHPWEMYHYFGEPPVPQPYGNETYVPVYRFSMVIEDMTPREISIRAEAPEMSRPLSGYTIFQHEPPNPETGEPGYIRYHYSSLPPQNAENAVLSLTFLQIVPAPGTVTALGVLAMVGGMRRRR
jgi:hypothetical protein